MSHILGTFSVKLAAQIVVKILLALALGGAVGFERERRNMPAGVRTFMLVSAGSCIFTILSQIGFFGADPSRIAAQIVSGIGFLGAGVTIHRKGTIHGLTSAAGVWAVAAVGMAVGTGNYFLATFGAVAVLVVMGLLRQWFKADVSRSTRRTLNTELRQVRNRIIAMGRLVIEAIQDGVRAVVEDDQELARQVIEGDAEINNLRYRIEEECLDVLRAHQPRQVQLRTVLAATHIATNLERMGDHAKEIAQVRLQIGHAPLLPPLNRVPEMANRVCDMLNRVLVAFAQDDVEAARRICEEVEVVDQAYSEIVDAVTERMSGKKSRHFERGAHLVNIAYNLKRIGERVTNIAERIIFVRTGALAEADRED